MVKFLCVTCQSIKDDMYHKWTDAGVSTCTQCVTDKTSIGHITSNCIETVLEDMSKRPIITVYGRNNPAPNY